MEKSVLIIYASIGAGHRAAAHAIGEALEIRSKKIKITYLDILDKTEIRFLKLLPHLQENFSRIMGAIYDRLWRSEKAARMTDVYEQRVFKKLYQQIEKSTQGIKFDLIVTTHTLAASAITFAKKNNILRAPHLAVATDLGLNAFWPKEGIDFFVVGTEEMKEELKRRGFGGEIYVFGIPVSPKFNQKIDRHKILKKYHLDPGLPFVLVLAGASSKGPYKFAQDIIKKMVFQELKQEPSHVLVIKSDQAFKKIIEPEIKKRKLKNVRVLAFVRNFQEILASADLLVTKPGGLTTAEASAAFVPMLLLSPYFGQEKANAEYLSKMGMARELSLQKPLLEAIKKIINDKKLLSKMQRNLKKYSQKRAALLTANLISAKISSQPVSSSGNP